MSANCPAGIKEKTCAGFLPEASMKRTALAERAVNFLYNDGVG